MAAEHRPIVGGLGPDLDDPLRRRVGDHRIPDGVSGRIDQGPHDLLDGRGWPIVEPRVTPARRGERRCGHGDGGDRDVPPFEHADVMLSQRMSDNPSMRWIMERGQQ